MGKYKMSSRDGLIVVSVLLLAFGCSSAPPSRSANAHSTGLYDLSPYKSVYVASDSGGGEPLRMGAYAMVDPGLVAPLWIPSQIRTNTLIVTLVYTPLPPQLNASELDEYSVALTEGITGRFVHEIPLEGVFLQAAQGPAKTSGWGRNLGLWINQIFEDTSTSRASPARRDLASGPSFPGNREMSLHLACVRGRTDAVRRLLEQGADVNADHDYYEGTPLLMAAREGHVETVSLLISRGADIDVRDRYGTTPTLMAAIHGHQEVFDLLRKHGGHLTAPSRGINTPVQDGWTPLHLAACHDRPSIVSVILSQGADVNARMNLNETALHVVAYNGCPEVAKILLAHGADVSARGRAGNTALHAAAYYGRNRVATILLDASADIEAKDEQGFTPLLLAIVGQREATVGLLLKRGADPNKPNNFGNHPMDLATLRSAPFKNPRIAALLREYGAR